MAADGGQIGEKRQPATEDERNRHRARRYRGRFIRPQQEDCDEGDKNARQQEPADVTAGIFITFIAIFLLGADKAASIAPRSMAVPFILGGWLPFLSYLSAVGRHSRVPLIVGIFALISVLAIVLGDNHSVRLVDASKTAGR